jgi:CBS domain containing-hemolysin-like protein
MLEDALQDKQLDLTRHAAKPLYIPESLTPIEVVETFKRHRQHFGLVLENDADDLSSPPLQSGKREFAL